MDNGGKPGQFDAIVSQGNEQSASEHTLGGQLIGAVRDIFSSGSKTQAEAAAAARTNDTIAEITADTVSMIPGVRLLAAGAIRAALLYDPHADGGSNAALFAKNFAEGVALNGVTRLGGKLAGAEVFGSSTASRSLLSEAVGSFSFGFGFGAVKSGFEGQTWQDGKGNFSLSSGFENVLKAGTAGGAIGIPAGFVGARIGALGAAAAGEAGLPTRLSTVLASAGSGYAAGAVFGGVDAATHGGSLQQVLASANQSGIIGLAAGGATGAMLRPGAVQQEGTGSGGKLAAAEAAAAGESPATARLSESAPAPERLQAQLAKMRQLDTSQQYTNAFDMLNIERPKRGIDESLERLGQYKLEKATLPVLRPNGEQLGKDAVSFADYRSKAVQYQVTKVRVYDAQGSRVIIPDEYAGRLDQVLALRRQVESNADWHDSSSEATKAFEALKHHPLRDRAHPADVVWTLNELPDRSLGKSVIMVDWANPEDPWHRQTYKPDFKSAATASQEGVITFYEAKRDAFLQQTIHHEWSHLLKFTAERESHAFDQAYLIEKGKYNVSDYSKRNEDENWAEHFETLTRPDATAFFETMANAPIRTAVMGRALIKALNAVPAGERSEFHYQLGQRALYIHNFALPRAQAELTDALLSPRPMPERLAAARLLKDFGGPNELEVLKKLARTSVDEQLRHAVFNAAREKVFYGNERWQGYNKSYAPDTTDAQINFFVEMAQNGSRSRAEALQYLDAIPGRRAQAYYDLLTLDQYDGNKIGRAFKTMQAMPDVSGKELAWREGLKLAGKDTNMRINFALAAFERVPEVRNQALDVLIAHAEPRTIPALEAIAQSKNARWAEKARLGLEMARANETLSRWLTDLDSPSSNVRIRAIEELGKTKDANAITPILKKMASGSPLDRAAAFGTLHANFSDALVKFYTRELIRQDPRWRPGLQPLLQRYGNKGLFVDVSA